MMENEKKLTLDPEAETTVVEYIHGEQILSPRPAVPHAEVASRLGVLLAAPYSFRFAGPGGWYFLDEPELHLGDKPDIVVPDLAGWRLEHTSQAMRQAVFITQTPDWICEVHSPATVRIDRTLKLWLYAREKVSYLWFIDPVAQILEVFHLEKNLYSLIATYNKPEPAHIEPFGEVRLDFLWGPLT